MIEVNGYLINPKLVTFVGPPTVFQGNTNARLVDIGVGGSAPLSLRFQSPEAAEEARARIAFAANAK